MKILHILKHIFYKKFLPIKYAKKIGVNFKNGGGYIYMAK